MRWVASAVLSASFFAMVQGADTVSVTSECKTKVPANPTLPVPPKVFKYPIEAVCPKADYGADHDKACEQCDKYHDPDGKDDTDEKKAHVGASYVICDGCANAAVDVESATDAIAKEMEEAMDIYVVEPEADDSGGRRLDNLIRRRFLSEGDTIKSNCSIDPNAGAVDMKKAGILEYSCDDCESKNVPKLLRECCKKCLAWAKPQREDGLYIFCSHCKGGDGVEGDHYDKPDAEQKLREFIRKQVEAATSAAIMLRTPSWLVVLSALGLVMAYQQ